MNKTHNLRKWRTKSRIFKGVAHYRANGENQAENKIKNSERKGYREKHIKRTNKRLYVCTDG